MPAILPRQATTDQYSDTHLGGGGRFISGQLLVANNPVSILLTTGRSVGEQADAEYSYVSPSTFPLTGFLPDPARGLDGDYIIGVQIKSAIPGNPAQVAGWLLEPNKAGLGEGTQFTGTISAAGFPVTPPTGSMVLLAETILTSPLSSIVMSGIVQTYHNLLLVYSVAQDGPPAATDANVFLRFNGDASANYVDELARANNAAMTVADQLAKSAIYLGESPSISSPASSFGTAAVMIPYYARTDRTKTVVGLSGALGANAGGGLWGQFTNGTWLSAAAISRVDFVSQGPGTQNFIAGSAAQVWGM